MIRAVKAARTPSPGTPYQAYYFPKGQYATFSCTNRDAPPRRF